jgi:spoIIIJ-associated protein
MEEQLGDILDNVLGLLLLEGSYDIEESDEALQVSVETKDAGRLIGFKGENLESLQLLLNQLMSRKAGEDEYKRVLVDVEGWRKQKEEELSNKAKGWIEEVKESGQDLELEPMSSWQRRIVHMAVQETEGVESESIGEGRERHLVIRLSK